MKRKYIRTKDLPTYLSFMGFNLINSEFAAGRMADLQESQVPNAVVDPNVSSWRLDIDEGDDTLESFFEDESL